MYKKIYRNMCFLAILTLILSAVFILSASYTTFNSKLKEEVRAESLLMADLLGHSEDAAAALDDSTEDIGNKRITLIAPDGSVLFDNETDIGALGDHHGRPEVAAAESSGYGETERYSVTTAQKLYYCAVRLDDGSILRVATASSATRNMFVSVLIAVAFITALILILSVLVALRLTDNIIKPIEKIHSFDSEDYPDVYEEIQPFLNRIARQNQEIKRQMAKVRAQKNRLQTITDNINEGLIIVDEHSNILTVNNCALRIFDTTESYVKRRNLAYLTEDKQIGAAVNEALAGEKSNVLAELGGSNYQIFCSPMRGQAEDENNADSGAVGKISGVVVLIFDVSENVRAEQLRREFTANVSHELKTPLTTIHGYAQVIEAGIAKPQDIAGFAEKIGRESSRLIALIDDIMKLSNLDESRALPEMRELSLRPLAEEVLESLRQRAEQRQVTLALSGGDTKIFANPSQITELIYNLCDNAIKYNREDGRVDVTIAEKTLTVADTGIGIPEDCVNRIFERFFRVDKSRSRQVEGTGLGLSIVKHISQLNGAVIDVASKPGEGSTFTVRFK